MTRMYVILAVVGWAWLVIAGAGTLVFWARKRRDGRRGFDVATSPAQDSGPAGAGGA